MRILITTATVLLATLGVFAQEGPMVLRNFILEVRLDAASGRLSMIDLKSHRRFVKDAAFPGGGGVATVVSVQYPGLGRGQAIELLHAGGNQESVMIFPTLPFALFRSSVSNRGTNVLEIKKVETLSAPLDFAKAGTELRSLGTGGLLAPDKNPGSYGWLAVAEPISRGGVVGGWLTFDRGSGVVFSDAAGGTVRVRAQIDYGRLRVRPGKTEPLETFALGFFEDARLGLESWADVLARVHGIKLPPQPAGYCTWYSQPHGGASDEKHLAEQTAFAATNLAPFGFSVMQIDDGWQAGITTNGPKRNFTTHAPDGPYPSGMKAAAQGIKRLGLTPGLWFMPFAGTSYDPFFKDHQDWFVKRADGKPYETDWGGTCLDLTRADVREYLRRNVWRIAQDWGYQYFKMDGLWTGTATKQVYVNTGYVEDGLGDAVFSDPDKTNLQAYREGLKLVRQTAGPGVFILGCCSPQNMRSYGGAFGLVDAMRIGPDNGTRWQDLLHGPEFGSRQYFLHGRVWYNDPDPLYVRADLPLEHARLICSWVTISGQLSLNSEWLPGLPPERLELLTRTLPSHGLRPRPVDLFDEPLPRLWLLTDDHQTPRRDLIGVFNWDDHERTIECSLERLGLATNTTFAAFEFWNNQLAPPMAGRLRVTVPARSCRVLAVRPQSPVPQLISTSRHITQGIVDVISEEWDASKNTLAGRSRLVGRDTYEMRIVLPAGASWSPDAVLLSVAENTAGVTSSMQASNGLLRVTLRSPTSRAVSWYVRFRR